MLIPSEQIIIQTLDHEIRRTILQLVSSRPYSYSELMSLLEIDSGKLYYHLNLLSGLLMKQDEGIYSLSPLGRKVVDFYEQLFKRLSLSDIPYLARVYIPRLKENIPSRNPLYLRAVIDTVDLICKLVIYLHRHASVSENLADFLGQIKSKALVLETSAINSEKGIDLRVYWSGVYDTLELVLSVQHNLGEELLLLKRQAVELRKALVESECFSPSNDFLFDLQQELDMELLRLDLPLIDFEEFVEIVSI